MIGTGSLPLLPLLGRLLWVLVGPLGLLAGTLWIIQKGEGWLTAADLAYFLALGAMIVGRWLEHQGDITRYTLRLCVGGLVLWAAANAVGNYWFIR